MHPKVHDFAIFEVLSAQLYTLLGTRYCIYFAQTSAKESLHSVGVNGLKVFSGYINLISFVEKSIMQVAYCAFSSTYTQLMP